MIKLITAAHYGEFTQELTEMHRLRYRVFKERLNWDVETSGGMEIDEFDALRPIYLVQLDGVNRIQGCVRLLPTTGPTMLQECFPTLLEGENPANPAIWESSRFALDAPADAAKSRLGLAQATHELFAGMIEFGLWRKLRKIVTVTDARIERILRRADWPLERIGAALRIGATLAVAGYLEISMEALERVRAAGGIDRPVLWLPAVAASG